MKDLFLEKLQATIQQLQREFEDSRRFGTGRKKCGDQFFMAWKGGLCEARNLYLQFGGRRDVVTASGAVRR